MSDRGNQVTLGTFIATFLYCLLVLRTIRSPEESGGVGFVPNLALLVAVGLALCSIAVLIFFIHHVPSKIHINSVIEDIGDRLIAGIEDRFPGFIGSSRNVTDDENEADDDRRIPPTFRKNASAEEAGQRMLVQAKGTGYIQIIDDDTLLACAARHNLVLRLQYQTGDFVHVGRTIVEASPPDRCDADAAAEIASAFAIGARRSALQDLRFLIDELVEIAARALSPGVNDPFTAVTCLDWLSAGLSDLASRALPSHLRVGDDDALRVIAHPETFRGFVDRSFGALAQYCATDMVASMHYIRALGEISLDCDDADRLKTIRDYVDKLEKLAEAGLTGFNLARIRDRADDLRRALAEPDYKRHLRDSTAWLGGSA